MWVEHGLLVAVQERLAGDPQEREDNDHDDDAEDSGHAKRDPSLGVPSSGNDEH